VPKLYQEFRDVFAKESFDELPDQKQWTIAIKLVPDARNFSTKVYPLAPVEHKQLDEFLDENPKSQRSFQTSGHVLRPHEQSRHIPDDDERHLQELIDEGVVTIYMDDILIFGSQTCEQHHKTVV